MYPRYFAGSRNIFSTCFNPFRPPPTSRLRSPLEHRPPRRSRSGTHVSPSARWHRKRVWAPRASLFWAPPPSTDQTPVARSPRRLGFGGRGRDNAWRLGATAVMVGGTDAGLVVGFWCVFIHGCLVYSWLTLVWVTNASCPKTAIECVFVQWCSMKPFVRLEVRRCAESCKET